MNATTQDAAVFARRNYSVHETAVRMFSLATTTALGAVEGKKTSQCFTGVRYARRDKAFDRLILQDQPAVDAARIVTLCFSRSWMFLECLTQILGLTSDNSAHVFASALIERTHTVTLPQIEKMIEAVENGEAKLDTGRDGNFFFVETGDRKNPVAVGHVCRVDGVWQPSLCRLEDDTRWYSTRRLLLRGLDVLQLELSRV